MELPTTTRLPGAILVIAASWLLLFPADVYPESVPAVLAVLALGLLSVRRPVRVPGDAELAAFTVVALLSLSWSTTPGSTIDALLALLLGVGAYWLAASTALPTILLPVLAVVAALHGANATFQSLSALPRLGIDLVDAELPAKVLQRAQGARAFSTFALPGHFGAVMGALMLALAAALPGSAGWRRYLLIAGCSGAVLGVFFSRALGAVVAVTVVLAVAALATSKFSLRWRLLILSGVLGATIGMVALRSDELLSVGYLNPVTARIRTWNRAIEVISTAPIVGVGFGGYPQAWLRYTRGGDVEARNAHMSYLEVVADLGILGLILLVAFLSSVLARSRSVGFGLATLVLLVHAAMDFDLQSAGLLPIVLLFLGLAADGSRLEGAKVHPVLLTVILLAGSLVGGAREMGRLARGPLAQAHTQHEIDRAIHWWPLDVRSRGELAMILARGGQLHQALREVGVARSLEPDAAWLAALEGDLLMATGHTLAAHRDYATAERLRPSHSDYSRRRENAERVVRELLRRR